MRSDHGVVSWQPAIDSAEFEQVTILCYRSDDDARMALRRQSAKFGLPDSAGVGVLPAGLWGIWMPSSGSESSSVGEWLEPMDDDGVVSALLFETREAAQRTLEILTARRDPRITYDAVVKSFAWDDVSIPQDGNRPPEVTA